jgi:peroxiredoxin
MFRFIFCLILAINANQSFSQNNFVIEGTITGKDTGSIILSYPKENHKFYNDTSTINDGKFLFTGEINQPTFCWVFTKGNGNRTSLFIEPKRQKLMLREGHFSELKMTGSFTQDQEDSLQCMTSKTYSKNIEAYHKRLEILNKLKTTNDSLAREDLEKKSELLREKMEAYSQQAIDRIISFISSHNNSYVSATQLYSLLAARNLSSDSVYKLYSRFSENIQKSITGILIEKELDKRRIGINAADFTAIDVNNKKISLSQLRGKYVLINFWASYCVPCIGKLPELKTLLNHYHKKGFEIINISLDRNQENWRNAIKKYELDNFINVLRNDDVIAKYPNALEPIPSEILVNPQGKVMWNSMNENHYSVAQVLGDSLN